MAAGGQWHGMGKQPRLPMPPTRGGNWWGNGLKPHLAVRAVICIYSLAAQTNPEPQNAGLFWMAEEVLYLLCNLLA